MYNTSFVQQMFWRVYNPVQSTIKMLLGLLCLRSETQPFGTPKKWGLVKGMITCVFFVYNVVRYIGFLGDHCRVSAPLQGPVFHVGWLYCGYIDMYK